MGHIQIQKRIAIPCKILTFIEQYSIIIIDVEEFNMLTKTNIEPIKKAVVAIKEMDADEEIREKAFQRETALRDRASAIRFSREEGIKEGLREGRKEGLKEGRKEGIAEGRIEMIRNLMETMGMDAKTAMITLKINGDEYDYYLSKL